MKTKEEIEKRLAELKQDAVIIERIIRETAYEMPSDFIEEELKKRLARSGILIDQLEWILGKQLPF